MTASRGWYLFLNASLDELRTLGIESGSMSQPYHQQQLRWFKIPSKLKPSRLCRRGSFEQHLVTRISFFKVCELLWILIRFQIFGYVHHSFLGPWDHRSRRIFVVHSHCAFLGVETKSCTLDKADGDDLLTGRPTWISSYCNPCYHVRELW